MNEPPWPVPTWRTHAIIEVGITSLSGAQSPPTIDGNEQDGEPDRGDRGLTPNVRTGRETDRGEQQDRGLEGDDRDHDDPGIERAVEGDHDRGRRRDRDEHRDHGQHRTGGDPLREPDAESRDRLRGRPGERARLPLRGEEAHRREDRRDEDELGSDGGQEVVDREQRDGLDLLPVLCGEVGDRPVVDGAVGGGQRQDRGDDERRDPGSLAAEPFADVLVDERPKTQEGRGPGVGRDAGGALDGDRGAFMLRAPSRRSGGGRHPPGRGGPGCSRSRAGRWPRHSPGRIAGSSRSRRARP